MDADRRAEVAAAAAALTAHVQQAVVASWWSLVPAAAEWDAEQREDARAASEAVLRSLITVLYQGDLDVESIERTRALVFERGRAGGETGEQLLQSVRVVGLDLLATRLGEMVGLSPEERWQVQQEAAALCDTVLGTDHRDAPGPAGSQGLQDEPSEADIHEVLLAELEQAETDLR